MLKISNSILKQEAERRGWSVEILSDAGGILRYTLPSGKQVILNSLLSPFTDAVAEKIADDKYATFQIARELHLAVPETHIIASAEAAAPFIEKYKSVVIKPLDSAHGNGVTINITNLHDAAAAIKSASEFSDTVILQPFLSGNDIRVLFIGGELAAASIRTPATVIGDGKHPIRALIAHENTRPERGENYQKKLNFIDMAAAERFLGTALDDIPAEGESRVVVGAANIGTGGTAEDITERIDPGVVAAGKKLMTATGFQTAAVDFIGSPGNYYILEINASPSLGLHVNPSIGKPQPVAEMYMSWIESQL